MARFEISSLSRFPRLWHVPSTVLARLTRPPGAVFLQVSIQVSKSSPIPSPPPSPPLSRPSHGTRWLNEQTESPRDIASPCDYNPCARKVIALCTFVSTARRLATLGNQNVCIQERKKIVSNKLIVLVRMPKDSARVRRSLERRKRCLYDKILITRLRKYAQTMAR